MKKVIILLLLCVCATVSGLDILSADFGLEMGWLPQGGLRMYEIGEDYDLSNTFYTVLGSRVYLLETLFAGGSMDVSIHNAGYTFATEGIDYMFEAGLRVGILEIFYKHNCIHPAPTWLYYRMFKFEPIWEAVHDRIGIKISGKIGGNGKISLQ